MTAMLRLTLACGLLCVIGTGVSTAIAADPDEIFSSESSSNLDQLVATSAEEPAVNSANDANPSIYDAFNPNGAAPTTDVYDMFEGVDVYSMRRSTGSFLRGNGVDPSWCITAGAIFLHRSQPRPAALITPSSGPGSIINASDYKFGWEAGPEIIAQKRTQNGFIFEGRYFNDLDNSGSTGQPDLTTFRMAGIGITILGGGPVTSTYNSNLTSSEFNVHAPVAPRTTALVGFRYIDLHDNLHFTIANPSIYSSWVDTNHLWGAQGGLSANFTNPGSRLQVNGTGKAGVYRDMAGNTMTSDIVSGAKSFANNTAFAGEVNFSASYQVTKHLFLRGGYMVMWIENVALASDAAQSTRQVAGGSYSPINLSGLMYQGASAGMELVW